MWFERDEIMILKIYNDVEILIDEVDWNGRLNYHD